MTPHGHDEGYLGIAIDHGVSFNRWLNTWGADPEARIAIKRGIVSACLEAGVSGLVLGLDLTGVLEAVAQAADSSHAEVWLGLPDQVIQGEFDSARSMTPTFPLPSAIYMARDVGAVGVKVGLSLERHAHWHDAFRWLEPSANVALRLGQEVIVEPYFRHDDSVEDRTGFLTSTATLDCVRFAKLDVHDPQAWSRHYGAAFTPWLARSEGLDFARFCSGVEKSQSSGCAGTMVGAAAWGIAESPVLGEAYMVELSRRLALLKHLVHGRQDK